MSDSQDDAMLTEDEIAAEYARSLEIVRARAVQTAYAEIEHHSELMEWMQKIHAWAKRKGFYDPPKSNVESCMLMVTEVAEAVEEIRVPGRDPGYWYWSTEPGKEMKPEGFGVELADLIIRVFDTAEYNHLDLEFFIALKMAYNETRENRHGKTM